MREHSVSEANDLVIWVASAVLSPVVGVGVAFFLWTALHRTAEPVIAQAAVVSLGVGLALLGMAAPKPLYRAFLVLMAAALVAGFALGAPAFARLAP